MRSISFRSLTRPAGPAADLVSAATGQTQARLLNRQHTHSHARLLKSWTSQHAWTQQHASSAAAAAAPALQQSATAEETLAEQWREAAASSSEDDEADVETMHAAARSMEAEPGSYSVVNFYHLVDVPHPHHVSLTASHSLLAPDLHTGGFAYQAPQQGSRQQHWLLMNLPRHHLQQACCSSLLCLST